MVAALYPVALNSKIATLYRLGASLSLRCGLIDTLQEKPFPRSAQVSQQLRGCSMQGCIQVRFVEMALDSAGEDPSRSSLADMSRAARSFHRNNARSFIDALVELKDLLVSGQETGDLSRVHKCFEKYINRAFKCVVY